MMEIKEGYVSFRGFKTYYRIANPNGKKIPLLVLHGGPGSTHNSYELFDDMALADDRPIISYDQLGCGLSALEDPHPALWKAKTWVEELMNLRTSLGLEKVHLLGHSWGGMLAIIYLCDYQPEGVIDVILSSTLSSVNLWREETHRLVKFLSEEDQKAIEKAETSGDFKSLEFYIANQHYYRLFVGGPWGDDAPDCLKRTKVVGKESYITAWGESEYSPSGTLKDYEYTERLKEIKIPVLLNSGANDESTPLQNKTMLEHLKTEKEWIIYPHARHMSYYEDHEEYEKNVMAFMNRHEE